MGQNYKGPKYFYGAWLSLGRLFIVLHINNVAYERDARDLFKFYIGYNTPGLEQGMALATIFELRWSITRKASYHLEGKKGKPAIEFYFQFARWFYMNSPFDTLYDIFGKKCSAVKEIKHD